jgi:hypothetical protein
MTGQHPRDSHFRHPAFAGDVGHGYVHVCGWEIAFFDLHCQEIFQLSEWELIFKVPQ